MTQPHVDTDVLIRFLTGDDPVKQAEATALLQRVVQGDVEVRAPITVVADAAYVLSSPRLYAVPRADVAEKLAAIVRIPGFVVDDKPLLLRALHLFGSAPLDFGDAVLVASMERHAASVLYSYDEDFDRFPGMERRRPGSPP